MKWFPAILWLCVLFAACFSFVHIALYVLHSVKRNPAPQEPTAEKPPQKPKPEKTEPIYYIVEKKSRKKSAYSKPKRIRFD